jgi:serine/threonine protein kinase
MSDGRETPAASASIPAPPSLIGEVLDGRYKILRKLGEGGMGEVYAAEHVHIEKRFAIKLLRPEIVSNQEAVQRFRQEARSSSSIGHRNIIAIEDFGQMADGRIYMCMELLNGAALNDLIQTPQPIDRMLNILIQTGHGLAAAHAKGIIHRDMKPENIFVTIDANNADVPKLLDFGIAKVAGNDGQNNLTRTGTIFGTPFYMAPEQALGNPVDARTDIYAVGVIMYEVFAGSLPFQGESFMGILTQHITTEPEPVAQRAANAHRPMPPGLAEIITRCMQKNPAQRFSTMDELVNALVQIYRGVAGAGMSTYMEAFPVSSRMPAPTPPPMTGQVPHVTPHSATVAAQPGHAGQMLPSSAYPVPGPMPGPMPGYPPSGGTPAISSSSSGLYDPASSVVQVPKKSKVGLIVAILVVLAVGGGIAAVVVLGDKKKPADGPGSQVASNGTNQASGNEPVTPDASSGGAPPIVVDAAEAQSADATVAAPADAADVTPPPADAASLPPEIDAGLPEKKQVTVKLAVRGVSFFDIYEGDKKVMEGPADIQIPEGESKTYVLKAKGFKDTKVTIDGKKKKLEVKMASVGGVGPGSQKLPDPPRLDCSSRIVDPSNAVCKKQYCDKHPDDFSKCGLQ